MDKATRAEQIAIQIIKYSRNELLVSLRFMDLALCKLIYRAEDVKRLETDGKYLYFNPRHIFNLFIVWALTGLWHGANWTFVFWGLYYCVLLILEKYVFVIAFKGITRVIIGANPK